MVYCGGVWQVLGAGRASRAGACASCAAVRTVGYNAVQQYQYKTASRNGSMWRVERLSEDVVSKILARAVSVFGFVFLFLCSCPLQLPPSAPTH